MCVTQTAVAFFSDCRRPLHGHRSDHVPFPEQIESGQRSFEHLLGGIWPAASSDMDRLEAAMSRIQTAPEFHLGVVGLFIPVVLVLVAENVGHVKSVALMTRRDLDPVTGRALMADGAATMLAGTGGGSGTTTYAENIGVMASSKVYSTAAYWVAGLFAVGLALLPKCGAVVATVPEGVLGGAGTVGGSDAGDRRPGDVGVLKIFETTTADCTGAIAHACQMVS